MNYVEPIRNAEKIIDISEYLKRTNKRNYILFAVGIYTGLRISNILKLRVSDVKNKDIIFLKEKKTRKSKQIQINTILKREFKSFCDERDPSEYLIKSRKGYNEPLQRNMTRKILDEVGGVFGLEKISCHSLRKTFGYHYYKKQVMY